MKDPQALPSNEIERLETLRSLMIMNTPKEVIFDSLVELAVRHFGVAACALTMVDDQRVWFKASHGLPVPETPREGSFCNETLKGEGRLCIPDLLESQFHDSPLTKAPLGFRFYAGVPLVIHPGHAVGTFCIIDTKARTLTEEQLQDLSHMAQQALGHIEARRKDIMREEAEELLEEHRQQIAVASKMAELGEMAAGVAHEINNPLAAIMMRAGELIDIADEATLSKERVRELAAMIESMSMRAAKTVKALRDFARDGRFDRMTTTSVSQLFEESLSLCGERFKNNQVNLIVEMPASTTTIDCRTIEVEQVLVNLLNNAFYAIRDCEHKWIKLDCRDAGDSVEISVTDNGPGIPVAIRDKIMQPFFTTKETGKGTGLGLSISQRIVESHEGLLSLDETSAHTRFVVYLPKRNANVGDARGPESLASTQPFASLAKPAA